MTDDDGNEDDEGDDDRPIPAFAGYRGTPR